MTMTGKFSIMVNNEDGSTSSYSGDLQNLIQATTPPPPTDPAIPTSAVTIDMLPLTTWAMNHDAGTPGSAIGTSTYPVKAPDGMANCRQFQFTLAAKGGFIYHTNALKDSSPYNTFCIETEEYFSDPSNLACMEKDLEQADATGTYVDMATQLNGNAGFLDITANQSWQHTTVKADPMAIPPAKWYLTKRYFKNLGGGMVNYIGSNDGGVYSPLDITVKSQPSTKWGKNILNFQYQFDGKSSGSVQSTVYVRAMKIHCWKS